MDGDSWLLILLFTVFIIFSAYFSSAESCFATANKLRIKTMAEDGNKRAKKAMYVIDNFDRVITTVLIGNNIVNIAAASVATLFLKHNWSSPNLSLYTTLITTGIVFIFGEMFPKSFARDRCDTLALRIAGSLIFFMKIFYPLSVLFMKLSSLITRLFAADEKPTITEEELYDIIDTAEEEGVVDEEQSDLIKSALDFAGTEAGEVMTMLDDIVSIDIDMPAETVADIIKNTNHSRIPVYENEPDNIVGTLQIRQFLKSYICGDRINIREMVSPPYKIYKDEKIDELLTKMSTHKAYMAIVVDRTTGRAIGLVTIEDFLEELVGEIWDEDDVVDNNFVKLGGNRFLVNGKMTLGEMFGRIGLGCDAALADKQVQSWVLGAFGKMPEEDDEIVIDGLEVTVDEINDGRISTVVVRLPDKSGNEAEVQA